MKKKLVLALAAIMTVTSIAGCGNTGVSSTQNSGDTKGSTSESTADSAGDVKTEGSGEPVTITIWHSADATIADTLQKQADALAPNIVVHFERKENLSESLKLVENDAENAPDMYLWANDKVGTFAQMGILSPITDIISEDELGDLIPMTWEAGAYQGSNYQLPLYYEALMFLYNKDLMETPPATTDELLKMMKEETTPDHYVFVEQHSTSYYFASWIHGFGGYMINENKEPGLDLDKTVEAVTYHKQFVPYMPSDGEYNTVTTLFTEGKSASTITGPWLIPGIKEANINLGIAPMPTLPNGTPLTPFSGVQGVQVLKHAAEEKKDAVAATLRVLMTPETGIALANAANCAPANNKSYDDPSVAQNEMIMALRVMSDKVIPMSNMPEMDIMWAVTDDLLASVNKNNGDPQKECESHQKDAMEQISAMQ